MKTAQEPWPTVLACAVLLFAAVLSIVPGHNLAASSTVDKPPAAATKPSPEPTGIPPASRRPPLRLKRRSRWSTGTTS